MGFSSVPLSDEISEEKRKQKEERTQHIKEVLDQDQSIQAARKKAILEKARQEQEATKHKLKQQEEERAERLLRKYEEKVIICYPVILLSKSESSIVSKWY